MFPWDGVFLHSIICKYNLHCLDAEIKDTHPCQGRPDVGNKTGHSLMASICMIWMDNCWIDHHDYATEMPS